MKSADGVHLQEKGLKNTRFQVLFYEKMPSKYHKKGRKKIFFSGLFIPQGGESRKTDGENGPTSQ